MTKFFIENDKGQWLASPDHYIGTGWTRDPGKAWGFSPETPKENMYDPDLHKDYGWFIMDMRGYAGAVIDWLHEETGIDLHVKEHEYWEMDNGEYAFIKSRDPMHWITYKEHNLMVKAEEEFSKQLGKHLLYGNY